MSETGGNIRPWIVCKFGGTSVSSAKTWKVITDHTASLVADGFKVCIVVSAVSQVTNNLEKLVSGLRKECAAKDAETAAQGAAQTAAALEWIHERHARHCEELGLDFDSVVADHLAELGKLVEGMRLTGDGGSPRLRARVLGFGELMSSHVGEKVLQRALAGKTVGLIQARSVLVSSSGESGMHGHSSGGGAEVMGPRDPADTYLNADVVPFTLDLSSPAVLAAYEAGGIEAYLAGLPDHSSVASATGKDKSGMAKFGSSSSVGSAAFPGGVDPRALLFLGYDAVITQGFVASTSDGTCCVLGRGGSDTSGALFAAALSAKRLEIWTDVDGMYSSDPRQVPHASLIEELSYREAQELAAMGAKVLHPRCLGPASWGGLPVEIHNTMRQPQRQLTRIMAPEMLNGGGAGSKVMAITRRTDQVLLTISTLDMWGESGFLSRVFAPFGRLQISVDLIATSQYAVSMTLDYIPGGIEGEAFRTLVRALQRQGSVHVEPGCTVVSIVGRKLRDELHGMADAFRELKRYNLLLLSESTEDLNMSFVLGQETPENVTELVQKLHYVCLERGGDAESMIGAAKPGGIQVAGLQSSGSPPCSPTLSPASIRADKARSLSVSSYGAVAVSGLARTTMLDPRKWLETEFAQYEQAPTPFAIVDLATIEQIAKLLTVFPVSWSSHAAVLQTVKRVNPDVLFSCRNASQLKELVSALGPDLRAHLVGGYSSGALMPGVPPEVRMEEKPPKVEEVARAGSLLGDARVLVSSVVGLVDGDHIELDAWFPSRSGLKINLLSQLIPTIRGAKAMSIHEDLVETLFSVSALDSLLLNSSEMNTPCDQLVGKLGSRVALSGIPSLPYTVETRAPVQEYIRYSATF